MEQTWTNSDGTPGSAPIQKHLRPWVEILGIDAFAKVMLEQGGTIANIPVERLATGDHESRLVKLVGAENAMRIGAEFGSGNLRIPFSRHFLVRYLKAQGMSGQDIARTVHCDGSTVRRILRPIWPDGRVSMHHAAKVRR